MPLVSIATEVGLVEYDTDPQTNQKRLVDLANQYIPIVQNIRSQPNDKVITEQRNGNQPSQQLDRILLGLILKFIIHDRVHGQQQPPQQRKDTLYNISFTTGLLSKYRSYSMSDKSKYAHIYTGGEYGYSIWEAFEFLAHTFLVPADQPLGPYMVQLQPDVITRFFNHEIPLLEEIVIAELSTNEQRKQNFRNNCRNFPHQEMPNLFMYVNYYKDKHVFKRLAEILDPTFLNSLNWAISYHKQGLLGIVEAVGEFLQEQHLSRVKRNRFADNQLQLFRELRNRLEHIEDNQNIFAPNFNNALLNSVRQTLLDLSIEITQLIQEHQAIIPNVDQPSHSHLKYYFKKNYMDGNTLSNQQQQNILLKLGIPNQQQLPIYQEVAQFNSIFRFTCLEKKPEIYRRYSVELEQYINFSALPGNLKGYITQQVLAAFKAVLYQEQLRVKGIEQLNNALPAVDKAIHWQRKKINKVRCALQRCMEQLAHYQQYFHSRDVSFSEAADSLGISTQALLQIPNLALAIEATPQYRERMNLLKRIGPVNLRNCWLIERPAYIAIKPDQDQLLGIPTEIQITPRMRAISIAEWQMHLQNIVGVLEFYILAAELNKNLILQYAIRYNLKALSKLIEHSDVADQLLPPYIRAELVEMRNTFAHSNPYVDKSMSMAGMSNFLIRYTSIYLIDILPAEL